MKIDYNFIKEILLTMEEFEAHEIGCKDLMSKLGVSEDNKKDDNVPIDKFIGHIKILGDCFLLTSTNPDYGFRRTMNSGYLTGNAPYRITARGYEFLDVLRNDTVFNKIKDFTISTALDIGKQALTNLAMQTMGCI